VHDYTDDCSAFIGTEAMFGAAVANISGSIRKDEIIC
jgi:hypothetical protein